MARREAEPIVEAVGIRARPVGGELGEGGSAGAAVLFGVDATRLDRCAALRGRLFDRVVWNFPHAGERTARGTHTPCVTVTDARKR